MRCGQCDEVLPEGARFCPKCGSVQLLPDGSPPPSDGKLPPGILAHAYPMKWYKALIYVILFLSALWYLINGVQLLAGTAYGAPSAEVYGMFPALKPLSIIMGLLYLGMAGGFLLTRQKLAGFRKDAVWWLLGLYVLDLVLSLVFGIAQWVIFKDLKFAGDILGSLLISSIMSIVFLVLNRIYFDNREELFVN